MTRIKFCGLTRSADSALAERVGAAYAGVIFAKSARQVTSDMALEIFSAAPALKRVGVFGSQPVAHIVHEASAAGLDVVQLHGVDAETISLVRESFDGEIWAVIPVDAANPAPSRWIELSHLADSLLLDTQYRGQTGGTGVTFDWAQARPFVQRMREKIPVVLAGGLSPVNVALAVTTLRPDVVDVSSGIESSVGVKDPILMHAFAEAVRSAPS